MQIGGSFTAGLVKVFYGCDADFFFFPPVGTKSFIAGAFLHFKVEKKQPSWCFDSL